MRFACLRERRADTVSVEQSLTNRIVFVIYNAVWWLPMALRILGAVDYSTAFLMFLILTLIRAVANLYRNNVLTLQQAESFPLRAP
jgi:hypothetical protein